MESARLERTGMSDHFFAACEPVLPPEQLPGQKVRYTAGFVSDWAHGPLEDAGIGLPMRRRAA